jgi:DNA polymerase (family 10)
MSKSPPGLPPTRRPVGCALTIGSDAHSTEGLANVFYGVQVATRAFLHPENVLTTLPLDALLARLKRNRA